MTATMERRPISVTDPDGRVTPVSAATAMAIEAVLTEAGINPKTGRAMVGGAWAKPGQAVNPGDEVAMVANIQQG